MFSKIIDALRTNNSISNRTESTPTINIERRSDEDNGKNNHDSNSNRNISKSRSTGSIPVVFDPNNSITSTSSTSNTGERKTSAIGIRNPDTDDSTLTADTVVYPDGRRRSSLFGYSTNATDDYMQKDLLSSSWS